MKQPWLGSVSGGQDASSRERTQDWAVREIVCMLSSKESPADWSGEAAAPSESEGMNADTRRATDEACPRLGTAPGPERNDRQPSGSSSV